MTDKDNFNSRTHVECDFKNRIWAERNQISTHALTWSATPGAPKRGAQRLFQLTHSRGVRQPGLLFYVC